jgi:phage baseplate assembly protein W
MARLYNQKRVAVNKTSTGDQTVQSFTYKGFSSNETTNNFKLYDIDLVKQDIINHFYIRKGEKLENPDFGTIIWDMIFEPFTEDVKNQISKDVETVINYDPRITVDQVTVDSTEQGIRIQADVTYIALNLRESMKFDFDRASSTIN